MRFFLFLSLAIACQRSESPSKLQAFKDVKKAVIRDDGLYNVICLDGRIETAVSLKQIEADQVCVETDPDEPVNENEVQFVSLCENPSSIGVETTIARLRKDTGHQGCKVLFNAIDRKESLIIFDLPPVTPEAITNLEPLAFFTKLKKLMIFGQKVYNLQPLSNLVNLEELRLQHNHVVSLEALAELPNLRLLDVSFNKHVDLRATVSFPALEVLIAEQDEP
ncbi:leucine-rich repeat domain-containing protein [Pseudobacteriovorax antillogorgiicola]|uniref:Leucine Rich repeat-containing protein n=1 Tax=Pseudobacteriovorax antillogorgiicola TaxID=1513793 RepID=A0A1Y6CRK2_9BACT|nr:leucine-rich repeat domain-containing protein [Pseudobacteriovorax antillogorgiicola]TCS40840.1 leucine rich repeat (LRR) protein [Pseudobacteriovorax antillogorgiicola]SMF84296.1 Leucine Rich repeat-containing protein [Pseudobacteriovorax antillogorgiicola]